MAKKVGNTYFFTGKGKSSGGGGGGDATDAVKYTEQTLTESEQMQARKNQGLYYEEEGIKTINYDINGDREGGYTKVSDEIIEASAVIGHKFTSYSSDNGNTEYTITEDMVIAADGTHPTRILFDSSYPNSWAILIFPEDMEFESDSFSKGVWFMDMGTIVHPNHIKSLEYEGVTVHQIPSKYILSTQTVPAVKMEVPSMGDDVYYNMGMLNVNQYVPSRDVKFSVEGRTVQNVFVADVINGGGNSQEGDTYTFTSGGLYWVQLELNYKYGLLPYVCAMVYVESDNQ